MEDIIDRFWTWRLQDAPEFASTIDIHKYDDAVETLTPEAYEKRFKVSKDFLIQMDTIDIKEMSKNDKLTYDVFTYMLKTQTEGYKWRNYGAFNAVNFLENIPVDFVSFLIDSMHFHSKEDFEIYFKRLEKIPKLVEEQIALLKLSVAHKTTLHAVSILGAVKELVKNSTCMPEETVFYKPLKEKLPNVKDLQEPVIIYLKEKCHDVIKSEVQPALAKQAKFIEEEYLPHTRKTCGVYGLNDGVEYYKDCLKWHIGVDMTPQEVFDLGLKEVARIREGMMKVKDEVNFEGDLKQFMNHLRTEKTFYHQTQEELLKEYEQIIHGHIEPKLPVLFENIPKYPLKVLAMPFHGPGGMYFPPSEDGSRPGVFYANLEMPETRPRFSMMALSLHEAIPGHHFQLSFALQEELPHFRKELDYRKLYSAPFLYPIHTAYIEGWALYCEGLGIELGAYRDPYDMFGRYSDEIFRACRLVVDPGLHVLGWSREKAINYMKDNTCLPVDEIEKEVDRYITWPGQACAYKIGELKILQLRKMAEEELGSKFNLKKFHDIILKCGPLPLQQLAILVNDWVAGQQ